MSDERKLKIAPVPMPLWYFNLREFLPYSQWRKLRADYIAKHGPNCQTCGKPPNPKRGHHAHEIWEYDTSTSPATARLKGFALACWHCHMAEHWGVLETLAKSNGLTCAIPDTIEHYCRINGVDEATFKEDKKRAFAKWRKLCTLKWQFDWGDYAEMLLEEWIELPHLGWNEPLGKEVFA